MIRRLRMKFVLMNMVFVTALLSAVFAVVIHTTRANLAGDSLRAMRQAAMESRGPESPGGIPGGRGRQEHLPGPAAGVPGLTNAPAFCTIQMLLFPNVKFGNNTFDSSRFARRRKRRQPQNMAHITSDLSVRK